MRLTDFCKQVFIASVLLLLFVPTVKAQTDFRFASYSDIHVAVSNFSQSYNQIKTLSPDFLILNGDVENDGVVNSQMDPMINIIGSDINKTFIVRGNHDDHVSGSATLWQNYFTAKYGTDRTSTLPVGANNYVGINSNSTYLTYSFDYGNSRFIGLDSNQYGDPPTSSQMTWLDQRLTDAEDKGLTHAFIYVHPPFYCVESTHCGCQNITGCGPSSTLINIINKHPIVSATFHGHEHILAWIHMSSERVPSLTHQYEEFITSSAGNPYSFTPYPNRMDWHSYSSSLKGFAMINVNGANYTVNMYHTGTVQPIWTKTFTKQVSSPTSLPTNPPVIGDANGDGKVDVSDYIIWLIHYNQSVGGNDNADFNLDNRVDGVDYMIWLTNYSV